MEFLIFWIICAIVTAVIANAKGRNSGSWLIIGFVLGIFGIILIACMPSEKPVVVTSPDDGDSKICPQCAEKVKRAAKVCRYCQHAFSAESLIAPPPEALRGDAQDRLYRQQRQYDFTSKPRR